MQFDTTYLTEAGRSLATGTLGGLDKIQFTRAVASSHDYSATPVNDLKKLTSIEDVQQTVEYSRIIKKDDTTLTMRVDFPSRDVTTAYSLYTVGFYARPENGDEILYGVLPSSLPDYIAAYDGKSNLNDSFQTDTTVSDADNVLITVSQAGSLNEADLDAIFASKHIATIDDIKANIPATVIDGSKPADFKEAVTFEKGAVDGEGNAIATTKNLADGDATTLKAAKAYADTQASDKVKTANTDNWQKTKVTGDDGGNKYSFTTANTTDLVAAIQALPLGYHTFYCQAGVQGNPSSQAVRGIAEITTAGANPLGVGYLTDSTGAFWSFYVDSSGLKLKRSADADAIDPSVMTKTTPITNTTDLFTLDPGTYFGNNVTPVNGPATNSLPTTNYFWVKLETPKANVSIKKLIWTDNGNHQYVNEYYGVSAKWHDWQILNENSMASKSDVAPLTVGESHFGADLDKELTAGVYSSDIAVVNGPFNDIPYVSWVVSAVGDSVIHQTAFRQTGEVAQRTYWSGAGWGPWKSSVTEVGSNKIMANGNVFVPLAINVATGEICLPDGTAITLSLPGGVKLGDHMLNISATDGLTIDNQAYFTAVADEATAASKAAADPLHNYTTEE